MATGWRALLPIVDSLVDYIGVAIVEEGVQLRQMGIAAPIIVLGGTLPEELGVLIRHGLTLSASSMELLVAAEGAAGKAQTRLKVHLKIDTGMERTGVHDYDAEAFLERSLQCRQP